MGGSLGLFVSSFRCLDLFFVAVVGLLIRPKPSRGFSCRFNLLVQMLTVRWCHLVVGDCLEAAHRRLGLRGGSAGLFEMGFFCCYHLQWFVQVIFVYCG